MGWGNKDLEQAINHLADKLMTLTARVETLNTTVDNGLSETRNLSNASNSETRRLLGDSINQVRQDLAPRIEVIRADINRLQRPEPPASATVAAPEPPEPEPSPEPEPAAEPMPEAQPTPEPQPEPEPTRAPTSQETDADDYRKHLKALLAAATISTVRLNCHRDLWAFLVDKAAHAAHFRIPGDATDLGHGRTQIELSGPSLIAALTVLWEQRQRRFADEELGDWAQACVLYNSIAAAIQSLKDGARNTSDDHIDVTIDLRNPTPDEVKAEAEHAKDDGHADDDSDGHADDDNGETNE